MEPGARPLLALCLASCLLAPGKRPGGRRGALTPPVQGEGPPDSRGGQGWGTGAGGAEGRGSRGAPPPRSAASGTRGSRGVGPPPALASAAPGPAGCRAAQGRFAYKLLHDLFANYSSALRPVEDTDRALNVTLQVTLSQIIDMVSGSGPGDAGLSLSHSWSHLLDPELMLNPQHQPRPLKTSPAAPSQLRPLEDSSDPPKTRTHPPQVSLDHLKTSQTPLHEFR